MSMNTLQHDPIMSPTSALVERFLGIIVRPANVFEALVETEPDRTNWLLPLLLYIVCATICTQIIVSQPGPASQFKEAIEKEFLPQLDEFVTNGTLTRQQADWMLEFITPGTGEFFTMQFLGTTVAAWIALFALGFIVWQLARTVLARSIAYKKALEIVGLTYLIAILERIVTALLVIATGTLYATPTPALLMLPQTEGPVFVLLSTLNVFTFWEIGVASIGIAHVCGRDFPKVFVLLMALWLMWTLASIFPVFTGS